MSPQWEVRLSQPRRVLSALLMVVMILVLLPLAFAGGWLTYAYLHPYLPAETYEQLLEQVLEQEQRIQRLQEHLAVVGSHDKVAQQVIEQNRQNIKLLEEQKFTLQQELAAYKAVLEPQSRRDALQVLAFEIRPTDNVRRYRYKLVINRSGQGEKPLEGELNVKVKGLLEGKEQTLELASLSPELNSTEMAFSFKYFQAFPEAGRFGELELPEGFVPEQIIVAADVKDQGEEEHVIAWKVQE